jgi:hypothetical protein
MEIPDAVGAVHYVSDDGRWLCRVPMTELRRAGFNASFDLIGAEHGDSAFRCADCERQRRRQRLPRWWAFLRRAL